MSENVAGEEVSGAENAPEDVYVPLVDHCRTAWRAEDGNGMRRCAKEVIYTL